MDPRLPFFGPIPGFDPSIPQYINLLHPDLGADLPFASGVEARLIEAEAALRAGDATTWLARLNGLRANLTTIQTARYGAAWTNAVPAASRTLAPLADPGTQAARINLMFQERGFWLYNLGHRLGDLRRQVRPVSEGGYGRPENTVFPSGATYPKGGSYGNDVNFPVPFNEVNNPEYRAEQCVVTRA
jgi:hypothetical protein